MMHTTTTLYDQLRASLAEIDMQMKHIKNDIAMDYKPEERDKINVWYWMRKPNGDYVLADLIVAKAQIVSAMANLKAADMNQKQPRR